MFGNNTGCPVNLPITSARSNDCVSSFIHTQPRTGNQPPLQPSSRRRWEPEREKNLLRSLLLRARRLHSALRGLGSPRPLETNNPARHQSQNTKPSLRELCQPGGRCAGGSAETRAADEEELLSGALTATPQLARSSHGAPQRKLRFLKHKP